MTSRQITVVALKCFAVYVLFQAMVVYPHWVRSFRHSLAARLPWGESLIVTVAATLMGGAVMVGFAVLAWRLAHGLAMLAVAAPVDEVRVAVTPRRLEEIGFRVLGVYFVVSRLPALVHTFASWQILADAGVDVRETLWHLLATLAVLVFGLLASLWPAALVDGLDRIANRPPPDAPSESAPHAESDGPQS